MEEVDTVHVETVHPVPGVAQEDAVQALNQHEKMVRLYRAYALRMDPWHPIYKSRHVVLRKMREYPSLEGQHGTYICCRLSINGVTSRILDMSDMVVDQDVELSQHVAFAGLLMDTVTNAVDPAKRLHHMVAVGDEVCHFDITAAVLEVPPRPWRHLRMHSTRHPEYYESARVEIVNLKALEHGSMFKYNRMCGTVTAVHAVGIPADRVWYYDVRLFPFAGTVGDDSGVTLTGLPVHNVRRAFDVTEEDADETDHSSGESQLWYSDHSEDEA